MPSDPHVEARLSDHTVPHEIPELTTLLLWCDMAQRPPFDVVLDAEVVAISHPVSELSGGVELGALIASVDRSVERGVGDEMPASDATTNDGKQFKANDRRCAYGLVVADFSAQAPVATLVIIVRNDILHSPRMPLPYQRPATRDTGSCTLNCVVFDSPNEYSIRICATLPDVNSPRGAGLARFRCSSMA